MNFEIKVTLRETKPPIWRRFQIGGETSLHRLHFALQTIMGWTNSHLYQFEIEGVAYSEHVVDSPWEVEMEDAKKVQLKQLVHLPKTKLAYEYDFGDSWDTSCLSNEFCPWRNLCGIRCVWAEKDAALRKIVAAAGATENS